MKALLLGCIFLGAATLLFWFALPVVGKVRPWITPLLEPIVAIAFVLSLGAGFVLIIAGAVSTLR